MIYPTVICKRGKVHGVRNESACICGAQYRDEALNNQKVLYRSILFRDIHLINCRKCKLELKKIGRK
jgi:hypothetical protein